HSGLELNYFRPCRQAVRNICNMLRPGGEAVLGFVARAPMYSAFEVQSKKAEWKQYMKYLINIIFFSDSVKAINPFVDRIPEDQQEDFLLDLLLETTRIKHVETNDAHDKVTIFRIEFLVAYVKKNKINIINKITQGKN
ncbi:hypothetical protein ANN_00531, partial [Periplaneta americana]